MATSLIGLGSNLGQRADLISSALALLDAEPNVSVAKSSRTYETAPVGGPAGQGLFLNAAAVLETDCSPKGLLSLLQQVEADLGRTRSGRWDARCIDLDLLLHDKQMCMTEELILPHPRMSFRRFVLEPACEIAPTMVDPASGWILADLLKHIREHHDYVAVTGPQTVDTGRFVEAVENRLKEQHDLTPQLILVPQDAVTEVVPKEGASIANPDLRLKFWSPKSDMRGGACWSGSAALLISNFWLGQSAATTDSYLDRLRYKTARQKLPAYAINAFTPKLLVLLDPPEHEDKVSVNKLDIDNQTSPSNTSNLTPIEPRFPEDQGPCLRLKFATEREKQEAIEEVVASILAMQ